jgi:hypothetical protein
MGKGDATVLCSVLIRRLKEGTSFEEILKA